MKDERIRAIEKELEESKKQLQEEKSINTQNKLKSEILELEQNSKTIKRKLKIHTTLKLFIKSIIFSAIALIIYIAFYLTISKINTINNHLNFVVENKFVFGFLLTFTVILLNFIFQLLTKNKLEIIFFTNKTNELIERFSDNVLKISKISAMKILEENNKSIEEKESIIKKINIKDKGAKPLLNN